jgi:hypothetical protein
MQDQVNERTAALSIRAGKLTGRVLARAMAAVLRRMRNPKEKHGKQSIRSLSRRGASLKDIEITEDNIKSFERVARRYRVDFSLKKDVSQPDRWLVFFRAKDADALTAAFREFSARTLGQKRTQKPSLLARVAHFRQVARNTPDRVRNIEHGGPQL